MEHGPNKYPATRADGWMRTTTAGNDDGLVWAACNKAGHIDCLRGSGGGGGGGAEWVEA